MPRFNNLKKNYKGSKELVESWDDFRGGLNQFLNSDELNKNEYADGENILVDGKGTLKVRPGWDVAFTAGATGFCRSLKYVKFNATETNEVLAMTDQGYLTKQSGVTYTIITGASFSSGYPIEMELINDRVYMVSENDRMSYYDGSSITVYNQVLAPAILGVSIMSANATGTYKQYYRIASLTDTGESLGSTEAYATGLPMYSQDATVRIEWTGPSAASGVVTGYNIYGRESGDRMFYLNRVNSYANYYEDNGSNPPNYFQAVPSANTTGGKKGKFIINHKGRLIVANTENGKCMIEWSGAGANVGKFDWSVGGGYLNLNKDSGDEITGIFDSFDKIIVFFNRSVYTVDLSQTMEYLGASIVIPSYQKITGALGCVSQRTICQVENDVFFVSRREGYGVSVMVLGYEPNVMSSILRTNEVSIKVKPILEVIAESQIEKINCYYRDRKYYVAYPSSGEGQPNRILTYDRERMAWNPRWNIDTNCMETSYDSSNVEHFLMASSSGPTVYELKSTARTDNGTAIRAYFKSRKELFGDWRTFKELKDVFINLTNISGTVNIIVSASNRADAVTNVKTATLTKATYSDGVGFGFDAFGQVAFGDSDGLGSAQELSDIIRWLVVNAMGRYFQIELESTAVSTEWELSSIGLRARPQSQGYQSADIIL